MIITIEIPEDIAEKAKQKGWTLQTKFVEWLKNEVDSEKEETIWDIMEKLHALPDRPTPEEIAEEIAAYRRGE